MRRTNIKLVFILSDIILLAASIVLSYFLRFDWDILKVFNNSHECLKLFIPMSILIKLIVYGLFRLYSSLWKYASITELIYISAAVCTSNAIISTIVFFTDLPVPRGVLGFTVFVDVIFIGISRMSYRIIRRILGGKLFNRNHDNAMIVGAGDAGAIIIKELKINPHFGMHPVVIVDDDPKKQGSNLQGITIEGMKEDIVELAIKYDISTIVIAIPSANKAEINEIYKEASKTNCHIKILPSVGRLVNSQVSVSELREVSIEDLLGRDTIKLELKEVCDYICNRTVLVTGGGGSIGSELCRQIALYKPYKLVILDNYENNAYDIQTELVRKNVDFEVDVIIANIREKSRIESIFEEVCPDVVFHAAAHKHVPLMERNPEEAIKNNVFGSMNLVNCADKYKVKRFVLISTDKAVNPTNVMGATKRIAEMMIQSKNHISDTEYVAVRFGNVLGSNGSVIPLFKKQIQEGGPLTVTHKEVTRFFMTIPEAVSLVLEAGAMAKGGEIFVLDMGEPVRIYDLATNLIRLTGLTPNKDIQIKITGLRPGEKLYEELLLKEEGLAATKNNKIFVAKPQYIDWDEYCEVLHGFKEILDLEHSEIRDYIKAIVPTYNY